jgi:DNA-directed RNA polymerase specialized sigma24 family protein
MHGQSAPGQWPTSLLGHGDYRRLVALASRKLVGYGYLAEDAVSRALVRWSQLPATTQRARIETIVRSEALSLLRSEKRREHRESRVCRDPSSPVGRAAHGDDGYLLRQVIVAHCRQKAIELSAADLEVFELLCAGATLAELTRELGMPRHRIKAIRDKWRSILSAVPIA